MDRKALEKPFSPDQVKHRKGNFNNTLAYLEAHTVIQRLNDALDAAWSFEVVDHQILKDEVVVVGRLTAGLITKSHFGSSQITRKKETGEPVSVGDDLKAATTDALKKAATLLGVGLHLYASEDTPANGQAPGRTPEPVNGNSGFNGNNNGKSVQHKNSNQFRGGDRNNEHKTDHTQAAQGNHRVSGKQLGYIYTLSKERSITQKELNERCVNRFGVVVDFLSRRDASALIEDLLSAPGTNLRHNREAVHA